MPRRSAFAFLLFALFCTSCNTSENPAADQGGQGGTWTELSRRLRCSAESTQCTSGTLIVSSSGEYRFADADRRGNLSAAQKSEIDAAVRIALESISTEADCVRPPVASEIGAELLTIATQERGEETLFEFNQSDAQSCYSADRAAVDRLREILKPLAPHPGSGSTPSPGPSPGQGMTPGYDPCGGKSCGDRCTICAPDDPACVETAVLKFCNQTGECSASEPAC